MLISKYNFFKLFLFIFNFILIFIFFINNIFAEENIIIKNNANKNSLINKASTYIPAFPNALFSAKKNGYLVGSVTGNFSVTPSGQAHYTVAIDTPPGTAKMEPVLSISYDSQSSNIRNGLLGMGFSLDGLSSITRCPSNKAQNGIIHGVDFSDQDRYCLSGEQLVAINGSYGQEGTEYRTYHDSQSRIISHGRQGNGPAYFTVETKGGQIAYYGGTEDSRMKAQGKGSVAVWGMSRIKNTVGNYLDAHYYKDENLGIFYPTEINYTGNEKTGLAPYNSIKLIYETRPDTKTMYQSGSKITLDKRLQQVQVYQANNLMFVYKLAYEISSNTQRSRLNSLQKCDSNGDCFFPTQFNWQTNEEGWEWAPQFSPPTNIMYEDKDGRGNDAGVRLIDLNGDGLVDLIKNDSNGSRGAWINNGNGWTSAGQFTPPSEIVSQFKKDDFVTSNDAGMRLVDLNGDGLLDLIKNDNGVSRGAWINNGNGWSWAGQFTPAYPIVTRYQGEGLNISSDAGMRTGDLNGDGLIDMIQGSGNWQGAWMNNNTQGWSWAGGFVPPTNIVQEPCGDTHTNQDSGARLVDLNGDGLVDFMASSQLFLFSIKGSWLNNSQGWAYQKPLAPPAPIVYSAMSYKDFFNTYDAGARLVDINGDGLMDFVRDNRAWLNSGENWIQAPNFPIPTQIVYGDDEGKSYDAGLRFIDLNGDGVEDIVKYDSNDAWFPIAIKGAWINSGEGWKVAKQYTPPSSIVYGFQKESEFGSYDAGMRFIDLNGDGLLDLIKYGHGERGAWLNKAKKLPDYLIGITEGLGNKLSIDYEPLSSKAVNVYTRENNAIYPIQDFQGPMYVVYQTVSNANISDPKAIDRVLNLARANGKSEENALNHITTYHYQGIKTHILGLGSLGFHQIATKDETTGITKITTYGQDVNQHNVGKELASETRLSNGVLIHAMQHSWELKTYGDSSPNHTYYFSYMKEGRENGYDLSGRLLSTKVISTTIDNYGNVLEVDNVISDPNKQETYATYTRNNYKTIIDNQHWLLGLLIQSEVTSVAPNVPAEKHVSRFFYDENTGFLKQEVTEPSNPAYFISKAYTRDNYGNILQTELFNFNKSIYRKTSQEFDPTGRFVIKSINALGQSVSQTIDPRFGKPIEVIDLNGLKTSYLYDTTGRVISETHPDGTQAKKSYVWVNPPQPASGALYAEVTESTAKPSIVQYFDKLNREVAKSTQGFDGRVVWENKQYDELDRLTRVSMPFFEGRQNNNIYTQNDYDVLGRVTQSARPDGGVIKIIYDGLKTETINPLGQKSIKIENVRGNLVQSIDNSNHAVSYQYDAYERLLIMRDSQGHETSMTYDLQGHKISERDPDKGKWSYKYNVLGELIRQIDAMGNETLFKYDALGRLIARTDRGDTSTFEYGNDPLAHNVGLLIREDGVANSAAVLKSILPKGIANAPTAADLVKAKKNGLQNYTKEINYDQYSRPSITEININGNYYITQSQYDTLGRPSKTIYPNNLSIKNEYNDLGYLSGIRNGTTGKYYYKVDAMDERGHVTQETHSNGLVTRKIYDSVTGFLKEIHTQKSEELALQDKALKISANTTVDIQNLYYHYDSLGNLLDRQDKVHNINESFKYDALNRLINWKADGSIAQEKNYEYDELGNMAYQTGLGHYVYGQGGAKPHAVREIVNDKNEKIGTFSYDQDGNQIYNHLNGKDRIIGYTSYEKPLFMSKEDAETEFYYNADREQFERIDTVQKGDHRMVTTLLKFGDYEIEKREDNGKKVSTQHKLYIGPYTEIILDETDGSTKNYELLKDNLGSLVEIADRDGQVIQSYHYEPFGKQINLTQKPLDPALTHQGFTGHESVESFDFIHMVGRLYDPIIGRFLSADPTVQDPTNIQSLNRYSYCINNPLAYTDPTGYSFLGGLLDGICNVFRAIGNAIVSIVQNRFFQMAIGILIAVVLQQYWVLAMLAEGAYSAFNTAIAGGSPGDILKAGVFSAAAVAVGYAAGGGSFAGAKFGSSQWAEGVMVKGLVGGGMQVVEGGSFQDGFLMSAAMQVGMSAAQSMQASLSKSDSVANSSSSGNAVNDAVSEEMKGSFTDGERAAEAHHAAPAAPDAKVNPVPTGQEKTTTTGSTSNSMSQSNAWYKNIYITTQVNMGPVMVMTNGNVNGYQYFSGEANWGFSGCASRVFGAFQKSIFGMVPGGTVIGQLLPSATVNYYTGQAFDFDAAHITRVSLGCLSIGFVTVANDLHFDIGVGLAGAGISSYNIHRFKHESWI